MSCAAGSYQIAGFNQSCIPAPPGTYVADPGASSAVTCGAGTYQDQTGQAACLSCPIGTVQLATGQAACITIPKAVTGIAYDPLDLQKLFAGIDNAGVYFSANGGTDWIPATTQPANNRVKALVLTPGNAAVLYAATYGDGVYTSSDSGVIWGGCKNASNVTNSGLTNLYVVSLTIDSNGTLYAGTEAGVFASSDNCATWTAMNSGLPQ
jgi:ligand-binding sensor domain-containing protein